MAILPKPRRVSAPLGWLLSERQRSLHKMTKPRSSESASEATIVLAHSAAEMRRFVVDGTLNAERAPGTVFPLVTLRSFVVLSGVARPTEYPEFEGARLSGCSVKPNRESRGGQNDGMLRPATDLSAESSGSPTRSSRGRNASRFATGT